MDIEPTAKSAGISQTSARWLTLLPLGIALNLAIGSLVQMLKLPIFVDAVGTIVITLLVGLRAGMIVGVVSFLIAGVVISPVYPFFCGTQAAIAVYTHWAAKYGAFRSIWRTILAGIGLGIVAGIVSAPAIVYVFGGVSGSGQSLITAFLIKSGNRVVEAVFLAGIASEPVDKTLQLLLAAGLVRGVPISLLQRFASVELLTKHGLVRSQRLRK